MAYERGTTYSNIFDHAQAPLFMAMLARRHGIAAPAPAAGSPPVYLDLGCAAGHTILALAPLYPAISFIGLDFNPAHISAAKAEADQLTLSNTLFLEADFRSPPADLPPAQWQVVNGIYSWLDAETKAALELLLTQLAAPACLLKLHYLVRPGACLRQGLMTLLRSALPPEPLPDQGRALAAELLDDIQPLQACFSQARTALEAMAGESDAAWRHDIFNVDFQIEAAHEVMQRLNQRGFSFLASSSQVKNLPAILVSPPMVQRLAGLPRFQAQTLLDHLTANASRDDLFVREPAQAVAPGFSGLWRFGMLRPPERLSEPYQTVRGQVIFERDDCRRLLIALAERPLSWDELCAALPGDTPANLSFWLDLLLAAGHVGPFLPAADVAAIDRQRLRRINRQRLQQAAAHLSAQTVTPLLAAEIGNCLEAGWFESLVLAHFADRDKPAVQRRLLERIHAARIGFRAADGKAAPDQLAALRRELARLEATYIPLMGYWGIDV
jgi:SAM-dependent methyltransferase